LEKPRMGPPALSWAHWEAGLSVHLATFRHFSDVNKTQTRVYEMLLSHLSYTASFRRFLPSFLFFLFSQSF
jgi:hypothetical protein